MSNKSVQSKTFRSGGRGSEILRYFSVSALLLTMLLAGPSPIVHAAPELDTGDEIVYLTNEGELRVLDPVRTGGASEVQFRSGADKGFFDFTLGDVNNDGDMEIIAIGGDANTGRLVVYDPVVASGSSDGSINGIPWRKLVEIKLGGEPRAVAAGNFDTNVNGDEMLVSYVYPANSNSSRLDIYHGTTQNPDGTSWSKHVADLDFPNVWRDTSVGDIIPGGAEEVLLIDSFTGIAKVYRPDQGFAPSCNYTRTFDKPYDAVFGQWNTPGSPLEFGVVRTFLGDPTYQFKARLVVFGCDAGTNTATDVDVENPKHIFRDPFSVIATDTNKDGEDEFFMLRDIPASLNTSPHLLGRNRKGDINGFEVRLDADNGYLSFAGGDIDGDGKGEIAVMRDNNIRIFTDPEEGANGIGKFNNIATSTNKFSIEIGDLDKIGYQVGYSLLSDQASMSATLSAGDKLTEAALFQVRSSSDTVPLQHNTPVAKGFPPGVVFNFRPIGDASPGFTPTSYLLDIDATNATSPRPSEPYQGFIVITSNTQEVLEPLRIPFTLTLNYARLEASPSSVTFVYLTCENTPPTARTQNVVMRGTSGVTFDIINNTVSASSADAFADWLTVSPTSGKVGDTLQFTIDPTKWTSGQFESTSVLIRGDAKTGPTIAEQVREVKVNVFCATAQSFLPIVNR